MSKPICVNGHDTVLIGRNTQGYCRACHRAAFTAWRKRNPKKFYEAQKKVYARNPEKRKALTHAWYAKNATRIKRAVVSWQRLNPKKVLATLRRNQLKRKHRVPKFGQDGIKEFYLNCPLGYVVDHIIPLNGKSVSGLHVIWNLQYLTPSQNSRKGNKY